MLRRNAEHFQLSWASPFHFIVLRYSTLWCWVMGQRVDLVIHCRLVSFLLSCMFSCRLELVSVATTSTSPSPIVSSVPISALLALARHRRGLIHCIGSKSSRVDYVSPFQPRVTCLLFYILTVVLPYLFRTVRPVLCYESNNRSLIKDRKQRATARSPTASRQSLNRLLPAMRSAGHR